MAGLVATPLVKEVIAKNGEDGKNVLGILYQNRIGLHCEDCAKSISTELQWCQHLTDVILHELDVSFIWKHLAPLSSAYTSNWTLVEIPVMPSMNFIVQCRLEATAPDVARLIAKRDNPDDKDTYFIGFVNEGEGMQIMRQMVHDWFVGKASYLDQVYNKNPKNLTWHCLSQSHGIQSQEVWAKHLASVTSRLAEYWSLWNYKMCLTCYNYTKISADPDADLIPDIAKPVHSWS